MSLTREELQLLEGLASQVATLRQEIGSYEKAVRGLNEQNAQLSGQITSLNAENKRLSEWAATVSKQVAAYHQEGQASEQRLTDLFTRFANGLKSL